MDNWFHPINGKEGRCPPRYIYNEWIDSNRFNLQIDVLFELLHRRSVRYGDTIALPSSSPWLVTLMLHVSAALGLTLYPIAPQTQNHLRQRLLQQAGVDYWLTYEGRAKIDLDPNDLTLSPLNIHSGRRSSVSSLALIIATSGSSGEPKGVMLDWPALYRSAQLVNRAIGLCHGDRWLNCLPLHHIGGLSILFRTALTHATTILHPHFNALKVWQDIRQQRVTHISLVPVMLAQLLALSKGPPPAHLRVVIIGGAPLDEPLAQRALDAGWPLFITYGMSESSSQVATHSLKTTLALRQPIQLLAGVECTVVDEYGQHSDGIGHIRLRSQILMRGYANPTHRSGDGIDTCGWLTTGDIGSYSAANGLRVVERADAMINSGGEKIHPHQVEPLCAQHPGIRELCVVGVADPQWGEQVALFYAGEVSELTLTNWLKEEIKGPLRPRLLLRMAHLPRLANGKIDQQRLKSRYQR